MVIYYLFRDKHSIQFPQVCIQIHKRLKVKLFGRKVVFAFVNVDVAFVAVVVVVVVVLVVACVVVVVGVFNVGVVTEWGSCCGVC